MILYDNLERLREDVKACGRDITLVAACKTRTRETVAEFMNSAPDFVLGENRVQELIEKYDEQYRWHFIGRLQTNKVKYIIDKVELIHSLDRTELAAEIEKQAAKRGKVQDCLVEVNMGAEESKGGIEPDRVNGFIESLKGYAHIKVLGIMSVLPKSDDEELLHRLYDGLYEVYERAKILNGANVDIKYLSAGMSGDYKIALGHGANMLRLGSLLFGQRQ